MAKPSQLQNLITTITKDVTEHPRDLTRHLCSRLGLSRTATTKYLQELEVKGWIARSGPQKRPVFSPGYMRQASKMYDLQGLQEDIVWMDDFKPYFQLSDNVRSIVSHGFTEMLNNAIDHSDGKRVFMWMRQTETHLQLVVSDDGIGIFSKIAKALNLPDMRQALFELSKGKFTTDPSRHSGEGVFFTSRMFDRFEINANGLSFNHDQRFDLDLLQEAEGIFLNGTTVLMEVNLSTKRTTNEIYKQFTNAPEDFNFSRTIVPMRMAQYGDEQLISRSQAKRLIARFDRFKSVILDFSGVHEIGQAFADEIFRVYANQHPDVELIPKNMTLQAELMWQRAIALRF